MEKLDDIKYILSLLLNLSLQDIGEVVRWIKQPFHVNWIIRFKSALIVILLIFTVRGIIKKYRLVDEYILFNTYDDLPKRKLLEIDYYINNFLKSGIPELVKFGKLLTRWKIEICNLFTRIDGIRISNAFTEAFNGTIKDLIRQRSVRRNDVCY